LASLSDSLSGTGPPSVARFLLPGIFVPFRMHTMWKHSLIWLLLFAVVGGGCRLGSAPPEIWQAEVVASYPHDPEAYTQGLQYIDGGLYESTGLYGQSSVREVDFASGRVLRRLDLPDRVFGEGMTLLDGHIRVLTWREQMAYRIDPNRWTIIDTNSYSGEGWGLTTDGVDLIKSDGTSSLTWMDPEDLSTKRKVSVTEGKMPVMNLNELEWVDGKIFANVYMQDRIVLINPKTGKVEAQTDLAGLRSLLPLPHRAEVLNGIAWNRENGTLLVTGKNWPLLFEVRLIK
jgi:glutamine cyclotransferase